VNEQKSIGTIGLDACSATVAHYDPAFHRRSIIVTVVAGFLSPMYRPSESMFRYQRSQSFLL
jgi:hypothetical protein